METAAGDYLSKEDTVVNINLRTEPNDTLTYALGLEIHHPIISKLGENVG